MPRSALALLIAALVLMSGTALAQDCEEEDCEECTDCRNTNFYYIFVAAIIIFLVFFYWRNRAPVMKKPVEADKPDETVQREG